MNTLYQQYKNVYFSRYSFETTLLRRHTLRYIMRLAKYTYVPIIVLKICQYSI